MDKKELERLLDESLLKDINDALDYADSFNSILNEEWLFGKSSDYFKKHYKDHVLQPHNGEKWTEFPQRSPDGEYRIKMPPMSEQEYEERADKLALETDVYSHSDRHHNYIGGVAVRIKDGVKRETLVKIRRHSGYVVDGAYTFDGKTRNLNNMSEIVVYIKAPDGSNLIITYMIARNIANAILNFRWLSDLPESETKEPERKIQYLVVDRYTTTGGENYFETKTFETYVDANLYFSKNKKASELIKVENGIKKTMSKKNPKNIVPEVKNKENNIDSITEAMKILNRNNFNK